MDHLQHTEQQREVLIRRARLARLDAKLRSLNEERESTEIPALRKLLDERLSQLGDQREAINE
jgi:hypothetical protein